MCLTASLGGLRDFPGFQVGNGSKEQTILLAQYSLKVIRFDLKGSVSSDRI